MKLISGVKKRRRQESALKRLQQQLAVGKKTVKGSSSQTTDLSEVDIKRINREIENLSRYVHVY